MVTTSVSAADVYEEQHVHQVYDKIASHFSSTRYKPWPVVDEFLKCLSPGSVGLDIGCGNGKYLTVNKDVFIIGSDRSGALVNIARQHHPHSVIIADILHPPHLDAFFDFAISIAVVHHLSSRDRRIEAIKAILQLLTVPGETTNGGHALIFVWALEQKNSRRGWNSRDNQDVLVPWVLKNHATENDTDQKDDTFHRYYHLYREGELEEDILAAGGNVIKNGYDRDNWWAIATQQKS